MTFQQMTVKTIRDGRTRVDWDRRELIVRKPRPLPVGKDPRELGCYFGQMKADGIHAVAVIDPTINKLRVLSTQGHDIIEPYPDCRYARWMHVLMRQGWMANDTLFDDLHYVEGELYVSDAGREAVKTALKENPQLLQFAVFGVSDLHPCASLATLDDFCRGNGLEALPVDPPKDQVTHIKCDGVVYKDTMYGKWYKEKNQRTIDCVMTGMRWGVGKYWGQCGALRVSVYDSSGRPIEICCVSGMSDVDREHISELDIGRVCEVEYERVGSKGRLQHPRFLCFRDDKAPTDCTTDQDEDLQKYHNQKGQ